MAVRFFEGPEHTLLRQIVHFHTPVIRRRQEVFAAGVEHEVVDPIGVVPYREIEEPRAQIPHAYTRIAP